MTDTTTQTQAPAGTVTEDSLLKSIQALEGKAAETPAEPAKPAEIEQTPLNKSIDATTAALSPEGKQALNASGFLKEFATAICGHVDTSLETLAKSIKSSGDRDVAFLGAIENMSKGITALTEKVDAFGKEPTAPATARPVTTAEQPLEKALGADGKPAAEGEQDPKKKAEQLRKSILGGLENMVRDPANKDQASEYARATIKFETTGEIDQGLMNKALKAFQG